MIIILKHELKTRITVEVLSEFLEEQSYIINGQKSEKNFSHVRVEDLWDNYAL